MQQTAKADLGIAVSLVARRTATELGTGYLQMTCKSLDTATLDHASRYLHWPCPWEFVQPLRTLRHWHGPATNAQAKSN
jgi:hypothetical protein